MTQLEAAGTAQDRLWPRTRLLRETALLVTLFLLYKVGRRVADGHQERAFANADSVWRLERSLRLPEEASFQRLALHDGLIQAVNAFYAYVHFPAIVLFLGWIYFRRAGHYGWIRTTLIAMTAGGLLLHVLVPLAPPRLLPGLGMIDTGAVYGPRVYGPPQSDGVNNQFAAMPSLHVGWALLIAVGLIATGRTAARLLWLLHPLATLLVVVATANHYWLDGLVGCLLVSTAFGCGPVRRWASRALGRPSGRSVRRPPRAGRPV
ncbi:phosphatase PAP2 family protein [Actinocorallia lasiicapitis]